MSRGYLQIVQLNSDCKNGKVYVYLASGTNLAEIYDPISGDEISNPVNIDSQGYVQAFHVNTETLYDIKAVDFLGATKLTRQNVSVIGGGTGAPGPKGIQGDKGNKGDKGDTGATGQNGVDGIDGIDGADGSDGVSLVSIRVDETSNTGKILYNKSDDPENWIDAGDIVPDGLGKVKNSESDSLDFLPEKIVAGDGIAISLDETNRLKFDATSMDDHKVQAHMYSTEADYAGTVLQAGQGIDISLTPDLNKLVIKATGTAVGGFYWKGAWDELTAYNSNNAVWYFDNTVTPVVNRLYIAMEPNQGIDPIEDTSGIWSEMMRVDTLGDMFVAVDEDDVQTGYLIDKIRNGSGIVVTRHTDNGGNAYLAINSTCLYSVTIGGVTKHSTELGGGIQFTAGGGSVIAWDGNNVKISSVALGETSTTAYRGDRGKTAYDHSQVTGNPHGTDFSELENKPTTLNGYGITDAMSTENGIITTQNWDSLTSHGVYTVVDWSGANGPIVDGVSAHKWGQLVVVRYQDTITQIYYPHYNDMPFTRTSSRGWGWGSWRTSPSDRVNLTDASGSSTLPIGDMTQPTAIQTLRDNVKHLQSSTTANGVIYADDWNNFTTTGVYKVVNWSGANGPIAGTYSAYKWGQLVVDAYSTVITQTYYPHLSTNVYFRVSYDGAWSGWKTSAPTNYGDVDSSTNWNNVTSTGKYRVLAVSGTNGPSTAYSLGVLLVDYTSDDYIQQTYIPTYGNGTPVCRQRRSGAWGYWRGSISGGEGMSLNTQIHYQSLTIPRTDPNAIYLCY